MNSELPQFDVENLSRNVTTSNSSSPSSSSQSEAVKCLEIHAGGFTRIEQHLFQNTANYLRRTQSFGHRTSATASSSAMSSTVDSLIAHSALNLASTTASPNDSSFNGSKQKISLTDYKKQQQQHQQNQSNKTTEQIVQPTVESTATKTATKTTKPTSELPSMSLIDEVKKRIKNENKANESGSEKSEKVDSIRTTPANLIAASLSPSSDLLSPRSNSRTNRKSHDGSSSAKKRRRSHNKKSKSDRKHDSSNFKF